MNDFYAPKRQSKVNKKWLIVISFLMVLLILIGYVTYIKIQKPIDVEIEKYAILNVMMIYDNELVETGFVVYENGRVIFDGKTSDNSATRIKTYYNSSVTIENYNLDGQNFFIKKTISETNTIDVQAIKMRLEKRTDIDVRVRKNLNSVRFIIEGGKKDFGELNILIKTDGAILKSLEDYEQLDKELVTDMGFYKGYLITDNLKANEKLVISIPYIRINDDATIDYCVGGVDKNMGIDGYYNSIGLGECNVI